MHLQFYAYGQNGKFGQNGKVRLGLNVSSSTHHCGCMVDGSNMSSITVHTGHRMYNSDCILTLVWIYNVIFWIAAASIQIITLHGLSAQRPWDSTSKLIRNGSYIKYWMC